MPLFGRRKVDEVTQYYELPVPKMDSMLLPEPTDPETSELVLVLLPKAQDKALGTDFLGDTGQNFVEALVQAWWPSPDHHEMQLEVIGKGVNLGLAVAAEEDRMGFATPKGSANFPLFTVCMMSAVQFTKSMDEVIGPESRRHTSYAVRAGYYLGREGPDAVPLLLRNAV